MRKKNIKRLKELCDENWNVPNVKEEVFASYKIDEFDEFINKLNIKRIETIAQDGISPNMETYINEFTDEEFEIYLDYHLKTCTRKDLMGYSSHILGIVEK